MRTLPSWGYNSRESGWDKENVPNH
jgi:hypothetical protein